MLRLSLTGSQLASKVNRKCLKHGGYLNDLKCDMDTHTHIILQTCANGDIRGLKPPERFMCNCTTMLRFLQKGLQHSHTFIQL